MTKSVPIGPLSGRSANNKHWLEPKRDYPVPTVIRNATSRELYTGEKAIAYRPGALDYRQYHSVGQGC